MLKLWIIVKDRSNDIEGYSGGAMFRDFSIVFPVWCLSLHLLRSMAWVYLFFLAFIMFGLVSVFVFTKSSSSSWHASCK